MARAAETGAATKGSQLQLQRWVNEEPVLLNESLSAQAPELAGAELEWRSPLEKDPNGAYAEYRDAAFLEIIGREDLSDSLREYWPERGPVWDGLAICRATGKEFPLLVEAKAHVRELLGGPSTACQAKSEASVARIRGSLEATRGALRASGPMEAWMGPLYQTANRLAHLHFLRSNDAERAVFLHLLFTDDDTHRPTTRAEFDTALAYVPEELGLPDEMAGVGHAFLAAL